MNYCFEYPMEVRDYECDLQGIVNNAVYQNYLEHTRHQFLHTLSTSFKELHEQGIDAVVARIELDYKQSLTSEDKFVSCLSVEREGVKYIFHQAIYRLPDEKLCVKARVETVCTHGGRLTRGDELLPLFTPYL